MLHIIESWLLKFENKNIISTFVLFEPFYKIFFLLFIYSHYWFEFKVIGYKFTIVQSKNNVNK